MVDLYSNTIVRLLSKWLLKSPLVTASGLFHIRFLQFLTENIKLCRGCIIML